jgi:hypothetical protein
VVPVGSPARENSGVSDENPEQRVTAVAAEVVEVRREAAAARALAAGADRDVADYRAETRTHTRGLEALRQTQVEHHAEHRSDPAGLRAGMNAGFMAVETRFAEVNAGLRTIAGMLGEAEGHCGEASEVRVVRPALGPTGRPGCHTGP